MSASYSNTQSRTGARGMTRRTQQEVRQVATPEYYADMFSKIMPNLQQIFAPQRQQATDLATMRGQTQQNAFNADVGRRGMQGSGAALFGKQAIRGQTSGEQNQALLAFYQQMLGLGHETARGLQEQRIAGVSGVPLWSTGRSQTHSASYGGGGMSGAGG